MWYINLFVSLIPSCQNILRDLFGEMFLIMSLIFPILIVVRSKNLNIALDKGL